MTKEIFLSQGKIAIVDDEDFEWLSQWKWSFAQGYASRTIGPVNARRHIRMHNAMLQPPLGMEVDHIDLNPLNNTRFNLRICTHKQNTYNRGLHRDSTSGYKGVTWNRKTQKWYAFITVERRLVYLGSHTDKRVAAQAYNAAAILHFGEFAHLNVLEEA